MIIQKSGSWYSYDGERLGQGRENAKEYIKNNPDFYVMLENQIKDKLLAKTVANNVEEELDTKLETN